VKSRPCEQCGTDLPVRARADARFCSGRCRVAGHRAGIPRALRDRPRWVTHTADRVPFTADGRRVASSTDPRTWSPYAAVSRLDRRGFVLAGDGTVCLDLDHALVNGVPLPWVAEILAACPPTYIEVSPSGTGLHVWGLGHVGAGRRIRDGQRHVEIYDRGRYITVTGVRHGRCPAALADLSTVLAELLPHR
jgi:primase-polymerase (primpol)-like protein